MRYITKRYIGDYAPNTGKFIKVDMVTRVTCFTELKENKLEKWALLFVIKPRNGF